MSTLSIRPAQLAEAPAIAALHVRSWEAAYRGLLPNDVLDAMTLDARLASWRTLLGPEHRDLLTLLAIDGAGEAIGFATLARPSRDGDAGDQTAELVALYVDPPRWSTGVGQALMDAVDAELDDRWRDLTLWVLEDNARAVAFYLRRGFAADGATDDDHHGRTTARLRRRRR